LPYIYRIRRQEPRAKNRPARYVAPVPEPTAPPLEDYTKPELAAIAEDQGVDPSGTKADIIERLDDG
jgi:hypothetical protein